MKISVIGTGYVGLTTGACLANLGYDVLCMDVIKDKIDQLKQGILPFYEPGLNELASKNIKNKRLTFTTDPKEAVEFGTIIFNCVGTPSKDDGSANLDYVYAVAKSVGEHINGYKIVVNKSTVPPGTARKVYEIIKEHAPDAEFDVVSNPEFLKEGAAIHDFFKPDKIVIGTTSDKATTTMQELYSGLMRPYLPVIITNWETAELIKYANNTFLVTKISMINELANIAERVGADIKTIAKSLGADYRISPRFLNAGVGYGGSCFTKDVKALHHLAQQHGYNAKLVKEINELNIRQKYVLVEKILNHFGNDLTNKTIAIWGLSFKPKTSDIRDAPAITIIKKLLEHGAKINAYDPEANHPTKEAIPEITLCENAYEAATNSDAVVLVTEWDEFRNLDMKRVKTLMKGDVLFDGRNIYNPEKKKRLGFSYHGIGRT